ncbi:MAG: carboxypeptidase regulatory-like domain-containing protein [Gemmatimonadales bacterium]
MERWCPAWIGAPRSAWHRTTAAVLLTAGTLTAPLGGQAHERPATLIGQVLDARTGSPIPHARVEIATLNRAVEVDSLGQFRMDRLIADLIALRVQGVGYLPLTRTLMLREGRVERIDLILTPDPTRLPTVEVEAPPLARGAMSGFEERRKMGFGTFFGAEDIQGLERERLTEVLRRVPGLIINPRGVAFSSRRNCAINVVLDGQVLVGSSISLLDLPALGSYEGIEVYPGQASLPSIFRVMGSECGVIVLWSRRGNERRPGY